MRNLSLVTKLFLVAILGMGLALFGCPPDSEGDDDDDAVGDDDDVVGDDDDAVGDDDDAVGDDDDAVGDDDDVTVTNDWEYIFDITYTNLNETGTCSYCIHMAEGTPWPFAYDADYYFDYYGTVYGPYQFIALDYYGSGSWSIWYYVDVDNGDHIEFYWDSYYYVQDGFWDITGGGATMEGRASTQEPDNGYEVQQRLNGVAQ